MTLSKKELAGRRVWLLDRQKELENEIQRLSRSLRETAGEKRAVGDMTDNAQQDAANGVSVGIANHFDDELINVANALARIDAGEYGACMSCEGPIALKRLEALPYAKTCLSCQEATENDNEIKRHHPVIPPPSVRSSRPQLSES